MVWESAVLLEGSAGRVLPVWDSVYEFWHEYYCQSIAEQWGLMLQSFKPAEHREQTRWGEMCKGPMEYVEGKETHLPFLWEAILFKMSGILKFEHKFKDKQTLSHKKSF